jgi:hypothetical protein
LMNTGYVIDAQGPAAKTLDIAPGIRLSVV